MDPGIEKETENMAEHQNQPSFRYDRITLITKRFTPIMCYCKHYIRDILKTCIDNLSFICGQFSVLSYEKHEACDKRRYSIVCL